MQKIIDYVKNHPDQINNLNLQNTWKTKTSTTKKPASPRVTVKDLKVYVEQRADEIVNYVKNQSAPDMDSLKKLLIASLDPEKNKDSACKKEDFPELFSPIKHPKWDKGMLTSLKPR